MADQEQTLTAEQAQQINFNNGAIQGYKEQILEQADKIANLRGQINVRDGLLKEAQQQLDANQKEIEDLKAKLEEAEKALNVQIETVAEVNGRAVADEVTKATKNAAKAA